MGPESDMQRPERGQREQGEQAFEALRVSQTGVFEVEAVGFQGREQSFNAPALGIVLQAVSAVGVADEDQPLILAETLGAEKDLQAPQTSGLAQQPGLADGQAAEFAPQWVGLPTLGDEGVIVFEAQPKRQPPALQIHQPLLADELPIPEQVGHRLAAEGLPVALQQRLTLRGAGVAGLGQDGPKQRDRQALIDHAQHQKIDLHASELPVGAIKRQDPGPILRQQRGHNLRDLGLIDHELAQEALQTDVVGADLRTTGEHHRQARQVDRAYLQQRQDEARQKLQPRAMPVQVHPQQGAQPLDGLDLGHRTSRGARDLHFKRCLYISKT